jgi:2-keto-3-deoxy-L-rhamnonate aldolase RhmA
MCPQVNSAEAASAWASALHYGPAGIRGVALSHRAARFGTDPDAIENARRTTLGVAQIESPAAVEEVEAIAAVPGIDVVFIGPSDLTFAMGIFRQFDHPDYRAAVERVVTAARDAGKAAGIFFGSPEFLPQALADGFRMVGIGSDATYMLAGARAALAMR